MGLNPLVLVSMQLDAILQHGLTPSKARHVSRKFNEMLSKALDDGIRAAEAQATTPSARKQGLLPA